ncbi:DUF4870 domain-containing protein [Sporosalibacterium faouarense]|uniref:DUF4870 domain-containing protein n=1 Tax=Sporosalibacterium faouarense TaxID=516123 RepID=UPI00141C0EA0|nr:DUF4870 domain-containing protein [Sporosalibacterium faouarense]MTI49014.1 DUF4870 domain-containing protein [Bacillota bacterium]
MLTTEQKLLCALSHLGTFVGIPIIAPLIVLLVSNDPFVKTQAKEALGFQIMLAIGAAISAILTIILIGILGFVVIVIVGVIFPIIAMVKVVDGVDYSYPISGNFIRRNF